VRAGLERVPPVSLLQERKVLPPDQSTNVERERLSSDLLFHYKKDLGVLCLILQNGFRHNSWKETLPYGKIWQQNFICCFCDILPKQAAYHRACYGNYALVLTKPWGISNRISPVRYVTEKSPGIGDQYFAAKNLWRSFSHPVDHYAMVRDYLIFSRLMQRGLVPNGDFASAMLGDNEIKSLYQKELKELHGLVSHLPSDEDRAYFSNCLIALFNRITYLHNEIEKRDVFMRAYNDEFKCPAGTLIQNKILYDEREWRSVGEVSEKPDGSHVKEILEAVEKGYLSSNHNIKFTAADLKHIVVTNQTEKTQVLDFLGNTSCLITKTEAQAPGRLITFEELPAEEPRSQG